MPYALVVVVLVLALLLFGAGTIIVVPLCFGVVPWLHLLIIVLQVLLVLSLVFLVGVVAEPLCCY